MNANAVVAEKGALLALGADGDTHAQALTHQISRWLFVVVGLGLSATVVCIVMYRTGSRTDVPWSYLAIVCGLPSALFAFLACFVRAMDEIR